MTDRAIDYDRGVSIREDPKTGVQVFMYKDTPGVYLDVFGHEVSEELAKAASFDVENLSKARQRRERMAAAMAAIAADLPMDTDLKTVKERDGFKIVEYGMGRHRVEDPDGNTLNTIPLPKEQAFLLLDNLAPEPKPAAREKGQKDPKKE